MNGAKSLVDTLLSCGVDACFANPGTSEIHFVAELQHKYSMRYVPCLTEGVVAGATDGFGRMLDRPAVALLHCGPGLANGLAYFYDAFRAKSPAVVIVGDQATHHSPLNPLLTSNIAEWARQVSVSVRTAKRADEVGALAASAVSDATTLPGHISTLVLPSDTSWNEGGVAAGRCAVSPPQKVDDRTIKAIAQVLNVRKRTFILLGGLALREAAMLDAYRIAAATGATLLAPVSNARHERGRGRVPVERTVYPADAALKAFAEVENVILVGAAEPVAPFGSADKPGRLLPAGCGVHVLATGEQDLGEALANLADYMAVPIVAPPAEPTPESPGRGAPTPEGLAASVGFLMPEHAIVVDESISYGRGFFKYSHGAAPHDWMQNVGGAIGEGPSLSIGAAIAAPNRRVVNLQADGSAAYTMPALWTQARERLNVTTILISNRKYAILENEMRNSGVGDPTGNTLSLTDPELNWMQIAQGMGVQAERVHSLDRLNLLLEASYSSPGPFLIELMV